ncbi:hypothetical protein GC194_10325 [bacterium]|nr:hypothetical protein [bacterium]
MKVDKLKIEAHELQKPQKVIGISGALDFYRIAYFIEKVLQTELVSKTKELPKTADNVPCYEACLSDGKLFLVKNLCEDTLLFPKAKQADFLVIIAGEQSDALIETLKQQLVNIAPVQSIFVIESKFIPTQKLKYFA